MAKSMRVILCTGYLTDKIHEEVDFVAENNRIWRKSPPEGKMFDMHRLNRQPILKVPTCKSGTFKNIGKEDIL